MYDHFQFHTGEDYPADLSPDHAATHMGMYFQWAAGQGLVNPVWQTAPETASDFAAMLDGTFSGAVFVRNHLGSVLTPQDFTELGQRFTEFYYDDEDEGYGAFMEDYVTTLDTPQLPSFYHVADTPENYALLAPVFQAAFERWKHSLK
ncbi:cell surface protein [Neisseria weixii]|uniref:Cell surface protein n=2 Tax=Neisseria weixii TaxID=1853276 RepID=A0A3N4N3T1_9NEIS|nr:cell surface protein [Neisseria weixii]RPD90882.1 cell surface protein [Neisseria weixii]RPD91076.1 cell surface protein [Neisseria weixii]